jgi:cysteine desulfurase
MSKTLRSKLNLSPNQHRLQKIKTDHMSRKLIYLDHNSTTPISLRVAEAMLECYRAGYLNPSSQHAAGRMARRRLEQSRESLLRLLGANVSGMASDQLLFTSGGTESNNLALTGLMGALPARILVSAIEHPSVLNTAAHLRALGADVKYIPVDSTGRCDLASLESLLQTPTRLVSLMLANNETGILQPVSEASRLCRQAGALFHCDAVQGVGKIPVSFRQLGCDALTFAAHKMNGPRGIGGLLLRHGVTLNPQMHGGFQQGGMRPGTEDVALAVGMLVALEESLESFQIRLNSSTSPLMNMPATSSSSETDQTNKSNLAQRELSALRDDFENRLLTEVPDCVVIGRDVERLPLTSCVAFPGLDRQAVVMAADLAGLCISSGSACASGSSQPSHVLLAMGFAEEIVAGAVRVSAGRITTFEELSSAALLIGKIYRDFHGN